MFLLVFLYSTIALLDDMAEKSMIRGDWRDVIEVADNLEELAKLRRIFPKLLHTTLFRGVSG